MKESRPSTYKNNRSRSIKNRNMKLDLLLMEMFSFRYAGKCHVFLHTRKDKIELVFQGVHLVEDIYTFSPNYIARYKFDSLYQAIQAFNLSVRIICSSMDWFSPELFIGSAVYDELFITD